MGEGKPRSGRACPAFLGVSGGEPVAGSREKCRLQTAKCKLNGSSRLPLPSFLLLTLHSP